MTKSSRTALRLLKLIGVVVFLWIILTVDRAALMHHLRAVDLPLFTAAFFIQYLRHLAMSVRWKILTSAYGADLSLHESWKMTSIGIFLGNITPGKIGEFGRAAYLRRKGVNTAVALVLGLADRVADIAVITVLTVIAVGILWSPTVATIIFAIVLLCIAAVWIALQFFPLARAAIALLPLFIQRRLIAPVLIMTLLGWIVYFIWAILVAQSLGITIAIPTLASAFTIAGLIALLPVAPSGLGTRDAALLTLLAPYGIEAEQVVALALLMFLSIMLSGVVGLWYWLRGGGLLGGHRG